TAIAPANGSGKSRNADFARFARDCARKAPNTWTRCARTCTLSGVPITLQCLSKTGLATGRPAVKYISGVFAKVFNQIFDSSIAEDYNCRRMFMDLLVLADPTGAVDMTLEAISRRTNVPIAEVTRYINELCQPDVKSRSQLEEGKRLVPLD